MIRRRRIPAPILILSCILQNGDRGTTGSELEKKTKLTRKTIVANRDHLKSNGLIDYRRNGQRATYFPGQRLVKDYQIHNDTFKTLLLGKLRSNEIGISFPFYNSNFGKYLENKNERRLFEFCTRLGISIVYILIQCFKPLDTRKLRLNESLIEYVGQINQILIERWLNVVISPSDMLIIFRQYLQHLGCRFPSDKSGSSRYSYYSLEKDDYTEILRIYKNLFPDAYNKISGIKLFDNVLYFDLYLCYRILHSDLKYP